MLVKCYFLNEGNFLADFLFQPEIQDKAEINLRIIDAPKGIERQNAVTGLKISIPI